LEALLFNIIWERSSWMNFLNKLH